MSKAITSSLEAVCNTIVMVWDMLCFPYRYLRREVVLNHDELVRMAIADARAEQEEYNRMLASSLEGLDKMCSEMSAMRIRR
jgi:hypothetical protein